MAEKNRSNELLALISSGKATAMQKLEFAKLLQEESEVEAKKEKEEKLEQAKAAVEKLGVSLSDFVKYLKGEPVLIFSWTDKKGHRHDRYEGERGKFPAWTSLLKEEMTKSQALELASSDKGTAFVHAVYK